MVCQQIRNTLLSCALLFSLAGFSATIRPNNPKTRNPRTSQVPIPFLACNFTSATALFAMEMT